MGKIIHNVEEALKGTPRPHYLIGDARYSSEGNKHEFYGKVNFKSEGNPSIADRTQLYMKNPHVNIGDCCFAVWNAAHIVAEITGYKERILVGETKIFSEKPIPSDTILDFKLTGIEKEKKVDKNGKDYYLGSLEGRIFKNNEELIKISSNYFARK